MMFGSDDNDRVTLWFFTGLTTGVGLGQGVAYFFVAWTL